jgi:hypothetical protein
MRRHEDLYWALRGAGGGQFAAVTRLVLRTLPAPHTTGFHLAWPWTVGAAVVGAWQAWAPDAPDAIAASLLLRAPADSDGPPSVTVFGAVLDQESAARAALDEFVAGVETAPSKANYAPGPTARSRSTWPSTTSAPTSGGRSSASRATHTPSPSSFGASCRPT